MFGFNPVKNTDRFLQNKVGMYESAQKMSNADNFIEPTAVFKKSAGIGFSPNGTAMTYPNALSGPTSPGGFKTPSLGLDQFRSPAGNSKGFNSAFGQFNNPTTYQSALNGAQQGFNSLSMFANATSPAQQSTQNVIFGSKGMMKMGLALEGINTLSNLFSLGANIWSTSEQIKMAKKQHDLAKKQFDTENARYDAREKERISNNEQISKSAALFEANPMERE
ncbi:hypothetical protein [Helicobacter bizzozeronii]|uniref:hypothetical protein n=1 Tax=Helicobacter bizzozeronii TaxID=56877 RepID=UPI000CF189A9|nr:hypothetical protein [Helicobacter bizzozeronii]